MYSSAYGAETECKNNYTSSQALHKAQHFLGMQGLIVEYIFPEKATEFMQCEWLVHIKPIESLPSYRVILVNRSSGKVKWFLFK